MSTEMKVVWSWAIVLFIVSTLITFGFEMESHWCFLSAGVVLFGRFVSAFSASNNHRVAWIAVVFAIISLATIRTWRWVEDKEAWEFSTGIIATTSTGTETIRPKLTAPTKNMPPPTERQVARPNGANVIAAGKPRPPRTIKKGVPPNAPQGLTAQVR